MSDEALREVTDGSVSARIKRALEKARIGREENNEQAAKDVHLLKDGNTACGRPRGVDATIEGWPMNYKVTSVISKVTCAKCLAVSCKHPSSETGQGTLAYVVRTKSAFHCGESIWF
jgi:hypothetical protein